jgi:hypothetical protein
LYKNSQQKYQKGLIKGAQPNWGHSQVFLICKGILLKGKFIDPLPSNIKHGQHNVSHSKMN